MNLNKVILIGRISFQPTLTQSKSGFSYTRFNIAVNRDNFSSNSNKEEIVDFIPLVAFGNNASFINRFFNKGDLVSVVGTIQTSQYTNKNGDNVTSCSVMVDQIKSLEPLSITQQRALNKNNSNNNNFEYRADNSETTFGQQQSYNEIHEPTFYKEEEKDQEQDDNPWELDL